MLYINAKSQKDGEFNIPVADVRRGGRIAAQEIVKASNGNTSKYIPSKYGYGPLGAKKY